MSNRSSFLPDHINEYVLRTTLREDPILRELRDVTDKHPRAGMLSGADQVQFLQLLVRLIGAKRCIEVGVFTGYTSLAIAMAMPDEGRIVSCDISDEFTSIGKPFWKRAGVESKIDLRLAPATETLDALIANGESGTYDFAYIDADKSGYDAYYERLLQLLRPNGLIGIDNVLWSGEVAEESNHDEDTAALRALNLKIGKDERVDEVLLTIGDGLTIVRKR
ncbi:MAG TPA: class I SAM-dependent methyltransferase [Candidatus Baltobacteraceae bacterium]|nr:class I SAM-dependent methyltransferase [Candidatus Baltobacteraceae bacterium]